MTLTGPTAAPGRERTGMLAVINQVSGRALFPLSHGTGGGGLPPHVSEAAPNLIAQLERNYIPEPNSGCWLWAGVVKDNGYARVKIAGKFYAAHRISYLLHCGPITAGLFVCHKCDVRSCINPSHLFLGTNADNMRDMYRKGRRVVRSNFPEIYFGERNGNAKLTVDVVLALRAAPGTYAEIAARFGLPVSTVRNVIRRRHWRHI